jgi:hypothetical protein
MTEVARDINDANKNKSALDVWIARRQAGLPMQSVPVVPKADSAKPAPATTAVKSSDPLRPDTIFALDALGSGSDYTAFLDHLAVPSLHVSYGLEGSAGFYHSIYDSYDFYRRFLDTTFVYGVMEARTTGTLMLRLADAVVLPYEFGNVVRTYRKYVDEIETEAKKKNEVKALDLKNVRASIDQLEQVGNRFEQTLPPFCNCRQSGCARTRSADGCESRPVQSGAGTLR